jgi:starch phosphorylase
MQETNLTAEEQQLREDIVGKIERYFGKTLDEATPKMIYTACALRVRDSIMNQWSKSHQVVKNEGSKKLYYLSFEFLMGRSFATNILNLLQTKEYTNVLSSLGVEISEIVEYENDAGLGNGGLGRLAACFLDSLTTLDLPAYGSTIRYEYGLFRQKIVDGYQVELPDTWLDGGTSVWEISRREEAVEVKFGGKVHQEWNDGKCKFHYENSHTIIAVPYDMPICGYDSKIINKLRLWSAKSPDTMNMAEFNKGNYIRAIEERQLAEVISNILYPEDNHETGKELRLKQQYFLVSATIQWIMNEFKARHGKNWAIFPDKVVIHINDTHPTMAIPEMMRILMDEEELGWDEAWDIVTRVFAYTNHTVMSEALEKWSIPMFERVLPRVYMIIDEINRRLMEYLETVYPGDHAKHQYMAILANNQVYMANLCLATCFAINGVSKLHTQILVDDIFADYYRLDKKRFHAITNGITFRRWIGNANPALTALITEKIGKGWLKDASKLENLKKFAKDPEFQAEFTKIKKANKIVVAEYIKKHNGIDIDPDSIFDLQCKRLHEYKRQLMNILHIMSLYNKLVENPDMPFNKTTFIFGAKAAPGYARAKLIIKLINTVADIVNNDKRIKDKIKVVFIENYGVSIAEKLVAAADVSEQISTAGKEASGTGNMKFMLNGAVTVGTLDGANVEMLEQVGEDYIYIFGLKANEVSEKLRENGTGDVTDIINSDYSLRRVLNQLTDGSLSPENPNLFKDLHDTLVNGDYGYPDVYMVIRDFEAYSKIHEQINKDYSDKKLWAEKAIMNTASAGFFSSDRTIQNYNDQIWHLKSI